MPQALPPPAMPAPGPQLCPAATHRRCRSAGRWRSRWIPGESRKGPGCPEKCHQSRGWSLSALQGSVPPWLGGVTLVGAAGLWGIPPLSFPANKSFPRRSPWKQATQQQTRAAQLMGSVRSLPAAPTSMAGAGDGGGKSCSIELCSNLLLGRAGGRSRSFWLRPRCLIDSHSLLGRAHPSPSPGLPTREGARSREAQSQEGSRRGGAPGGRGPLQPRDWGLDFGCKGQGCCGVSGGRAQWRADACPAGAALPEPPLPRAPSSVRGATGGGAPSGGAAVGAGRRTQHAWNGTAWGGGAAFLSFNRGKITLPPVWLHCQ